MFPCEKCGCCCRNVGNTPWAKYMALPNGICRYLDQVSNLCTIYDKRPIFCNIDKFYTKFVSDKMSRENFYVLNKRECLKLQHSFFHVKEES